MALVPASSRGGFTGGTVANPVTLAGRSAAADALDITTTALASDYGQIIEVDNGAGAAVFTLSSSGDTAFRLRRADATVDFIQGVASTRDFVRFFDSLGARTAAITLGGALMTACHAAPADAELAAGDCVLWFDQTDGAGNTKLMVKAKSANGTVKTATILLA